MFELQPKCRCSRSNGTFDGASTDVYLASVIRIYNKREAHVLDIDERSFVFLESDQRSKNRQKRQSTQVFFDMGIRSTCFLRQIGGLVASHYSFSQSFFTSYRLQDIEFRYGGLMLQTESSLSNQPIEIQKGKGKILVTEPLVTAMQFSCQRFVLPSPIFLTLSIIWLIIDTSQQ